MGKTTYAIRKILTVKAWVSGVHRRCRAKCRPGLKPLLVASYFRKSVWPWLSQTTVLRRVKKLELRLDDRTQYGLFRRALFRLGSAKRSIIFGLSLLIGQISIAVLWGIFYWQGVSDDGLSSLNGALVTIAEVVGGLTALLYAVILFAIQFHAETLGETPFLIRYLIRREGILPIAAFLLSIVGANATVALVGPLWHPRSVAALAALNIPLLGVAFIAALFLIHGMSEGIASDFFAGSVVPGVLWESNQDLKHKAYLCAMQAKFQQRLRDLGVRFTPWGDLFFRNEPGISVFRIKCRGEVCDVNLRVLAQTVALLRTSCPDFEIHFVIGPGSLSADRPILFLLPREGAETEAQQLGFRTRMKIQRLLKQCFAFSCRGEHPVAAIVARVEEAVVQQAAKGDSVGFARSLDLKTMLVERELEYAKQVEDIQAGLSEYLAVMSDRLGSRDTLFYETAQVAVHSEDRSNIRRYVQFCAGLMVKAITERHAGMLTITGKVIEATYWRAREVPGVQDWIGGIIDTNVHRVLSAITARRPDMTHNPPAEEDLPLLQIVLAGTLRLVKIAMERGAWNDAMDFHDRIFEFDRHGHLRDAVRCGMASDTVVTLVNLHLYAELVIAGWAVNLACNHERRDEGVCRIFWAARRTLSARWEVVRLWETIHTGDRPLALFGEPFELGFWEEPGQRTRVGVHETHPNTDWLRTGFIALALSLHDHPSHQRDGWLTSPPPIGYDLNQVRQIAAPLMGDGFVCQQMLSLDAYVNQPGVGRFPNSGPINQVCWLLDQRRRAMRLADLRIAVDGPLSEQRRQRMEREVSGRLEGEDRILAVLRANGVQVDPSGAEGMDSAILQFRYPRDQFVEDGPQILGVEDHLAQDVVRYHEFRLLLPLRSSPTTVQVVNAAQLRSALDAALENLLSRGRQPSAIIMPYRVEWADALSEGGQYWQHRSPNQFGPGHMTVYRGVPVYGLFPRGQNVIAVVDLAAYFRLLDRVPSVTINLQDSFTEQNQALLNQAEQSEGLPDVEEAQMSVLLRMNHSPAVVLGDMAAAVGVEIVVAGQTAGL